MSRPIHFEIHVDDIERAKQFYADAFGWQYEDYSGTAGIEYWGIITGPQDEHGINGGMLKRPVPTGGPMSGTNAYICTMSTDDFDATHDKIMAAGGIVALPKMAITGMAWQGYYLDPEGNTFGVHQRDTNAK